MQLFLIWAAVRLAMAPSAVGLQNFSVWFIFAATTGVVYARAERGTLERAFKWWQRLSILAALFYIIEVAREGLGAGGFPYSARGAGWVCVFALILVIPMTVARRSSWWPAAFLIVAIALSLSRTPLAIAAILLIVAVALRPWKKRRPSNGRVAVRFVATCAVVCASAYVLVTRVPAIQKRFTDGDGFAVGGLEINSSGRSVLWSMTIDQWKQSPWIGHGPGTAQTMISERFPGWISHPHNEYLRFLDDTGIVGLVLWSLGMLTLLVRAARAVLRTNDVLDRTVHIAAGLSVLVILFGSITDNVTVYIYCAMIAGSVIGLSAHLSSNETSGRLGPSSRMHAARR